MKAIAFFNNKGGVGKTTLACNVAAHLAMAKSRVLLVDCDPQCNSTQLVLTPDLCDDIYYSDATHDTLLDVIKPIRDGEAEISRHVAPILSSRNRFRIDLLPGHPEMSVLEDLLGESWGKIKAGDVGSFRRSNWAKALLDHFSDRYDLVVFDLGPSLGALNRTVMLATHFFLVPMGCDIFSILGIRNMGKWISQWMKEYGRGLGYLNEQNADATTTYTIAKNIAINTGFIGYTVLQYITKSKGGERRPTIAFERILGDIPNEIKKNLGPFTSQSISDSDLNLGDVPNMFSLVPLAQSANAPIIGLESADGLVGAQYQQLRVYSAFIEQVANKVAENIGLSE